jgi:hypothetical protein
MELNIKTIAISAALLLVVGYGSGRFATPAKVVTKIEEKIQIKEVVKYKETKSKDENRNKETIITETILPDGTKTVSKRIVDKSVIETDTNKESEKSVSSETTRKSETTVKYSNSNWNVALMAGAGSLPELTRQEFGYGLHVQYRILGPFYLGGYGTGLGRSSQESYGLSLGGSF